MASRGCPFKCIFCASHRVHGRDMRYVSLDRVKDDLLCLRDQYGAKLIVFQDDHFMGDKNNAIEILKFVKGSGLKAFFPNSLAIYALDLDTLQLLKDVGMVQIQLSIESGSDRVLRKVMRKPQKLSHVKRVVDDCRKLGIYTNANILIGLPGETKSDIEDSRNFLKTINANWFQMVIASPLVGSEMHDICVANDYIKGDIRKSDYKNAVVETEDFTAKYIQDTVYHMNLDLNFVHNSDFRLGNYEMALKGFHNVLRVKPDHAFAFYFASKCFEKLGELEKSEYYLGKARSIYNENELWRDYFSQFSLPVMSYRA